MPAAPTPKAYSYVRFSTVEQRGGDSLRRQTEAAEKWATQRGLELDQHSYQDLGVSAFRGRNAESGMLGQFRLAVEDGVIAPGSFLLIENLDRLSRSPARQSLQLLGRICDLGITVVTLNDGREYTSESLDGDTTSLFVALIVAARAHEESLTKSRRLREAWNRKKRDAANSKAPMTERLPAWLALNSDRSAIVPIDERAAVVRRIFAMAEQGVGQHSIALALTREGVPTFGNGGGRQATVWHRSYIAKILKNPAVIGTMVPHETRVVNGRRVRDPLDPIPNYYPAVISSEVFERLNGPTSATPAPRMRGSTGQVSSLLAALAVCPLCGSTMTRVNKGKGNGVPYLVCTKAKAGGGCRYRQVRITEVEGAIRDRAAAVFVEDMPAPDDDLNSARNDLEMREVATRETIERLLDEIERGGSSRALRERLSRQEADLANVHAELVALEQQVKGDIRLSVDRRVRALVDLLNDPVSSAASINAGLRQCFAKCVVDYRHGSLEFYWQHSSRPTNLVYGWPDEV